MKDSKSAKRVRFADDDEVFPLHPAKIQNRDLYKEKKSSDSEGDSDEDEDEELFDKPKLRRNEVNLDGYDSDDLKSEAEHVLSWKNPVADDDDDMFGDSKPEDQSSQKPKLVDIDEFEGQEDGDSDEESKIEAFNLKGMDKDGQFDDAGNFVWKPKVKENPHDTWLTGISKEEIAKAKAARDRQLERQAELEREKNSLAVTDDQGLDQYTPDEVKLLLLNLMQPRETVLSSLSRLGGGTQGKKRIRVNKNRAKKEAMEPPKSDADVQLDAQRKKNIGRITDLAAHLIEQGQLSIYQESYESLVRSARISELIPDDWIPGTPLQLPK